MTTTKENMAAPPVSRNPGHLDSKYASARSFLFFPPVFRVYQNQKTGHSLPDPNSAPDSPVYRILQRIRQ